MDGPIPLFSIPSVRFVSFVAMAAKTKKRLALQWHFASSCSKFIVATCEPMDASGIAATDETKSEQTKKNAGSDRKMHYTEKPQFCSEEEMVSRLGYVQGGDDTYLQYYPQITISPAPGNVQSQEPQLPCPFGSKIVFIISIFSGQRRGGDIQCLYEGIKRCKHRACILSADIVNDRTL